MHLSQIRSALTNRRFRKDVLRNAAIILGVFILLNISILVIFSGRTYPNTSIGGIKMGMMSNSALEKKLNQASLLPNTVSLVYQEKTTKLSTGELGIAVDAQASATRAKKQRSWLPVLDLFRRHQVALVLRVDDKTYQPQQEKLAQSYRQDPANAEVTLKDGVFAIKKEVPGYRLDEQTIKSTIVSQIGQGKSTVAVPVVILNPQITAEKLKPELATLQKQQAVAITFRFEAKNKRLNSKEISSWYISANGLYVLSDGAIRNNLAAVAKELGVRPQNLDEAVRAAKRALQQYEALDFKFVPVPVSKKFTYCTRARGVDTSQLEALESKLQAVYSDDRGWSLGGAVSYTKVDSGCNFTMWLAAADQMSSFGSICDADWSCAVSPNVIINFDRWRFASTAWNNASGSLDDYRSMVINHETGHWLGFGHYNCGGAGQPAPVMQQQSINLQGCKFNPWPTASELITLKAWLNI
jgi:hypothetical protein